MFVRLEYLTYGVKKPVQQVTRNSLQSSYPSHSFMFPICHYLAYIFLPNFVVVIIVVNTYVHKALVSPLS